MGPEETPVLILCGGRGTRLQHESASIPKALVEIGEMPIVWHVAMCYLKAGFRKIWLLTGYLGDEIKVFVDGEEWPSGAEVECIPTGIDTPTGGRVAAVADRLGPGQFCLTYGDGVSDIDLAALLAGHQESGAPVTVTAVQPELPFGVLDLSADLITGFHEKPRADQWINGGFICAGPELLASLEGDSVLEREPLEQLAAAGQLRAHRHGGFWACMDTYKDTLMLNDLYDRNEAPWRRW